MHTDYYMIVKRIHCHIFIFLSIWVTVFIVFQF